MEAWDFLVDKADLKRTVVRQSGTDKDGLQGGEVLLAIERFALTANNITYAVFGDRLGYWSFFGAPEGWGRIPVWGFAHVIASRCEDVEEGTRLYGYWPMSTHARALLRRSGTAFVDEAPHRAALPRAYNRYEVAPRSERDDHFALLRPLFTTSFLLDDFVLELAPEATAVLASASSRTAIGLAWMLRQRGGRCVGLTSAGNAAFAQGLGLYDEIATYEQADTLPTDGPMVFLDMAGDPGVRRAVHAHLGDHLVQSAVVGSTHHEAAPPLERALSGPKPTLFFAPDRLVKRQEQWGSAVLEERVRTALTRFIDHSPWLKIDTSRGPEELARVYHQVVSGAAAPSTGHIILPS